MKVVLGRYEAPLPEGRQRGRKMAAWAAYQSSTMHAQAAARGGTMAWRHGVGVWWCVVALTALLPTLQNRGGSGGAQGQVCRGTSHQGPHLTTDTTGPTPLPTPSPPPTHLHTLYTRPNLNTCLSSTPTNSPPESHATKVTSIT